MRLHSSWSQQGLHVCNSSCIEFFVANAEKREFERKRVLEVGSCFVNGSVRPIVEKFLAPREYLGVDIEPGRYVDMVLPAQELVKRFGRASFDVVLSTETLEHVADWRAVVANIKEVLKEGGSLYLTTRSYGFRAHSAPYDFWRYELRDFETIFRDFETRVIQADPEAPGVFFKGVKPIGWTSSDLSSVSLYSMLTGRRTTNLPLPDDVPLGRRMIQKLLQSRVRRTLPVELASRLERKYDAVPDYI